MDFNEQLALKYRYCEFPHCDKVATVEWIKADEDDRAAGESYIYCTDRCEAHPETLDYIDRPIVYQDGPVLCPRCGQKTYYENIGVCDNCERQEAKL